MSEQTQQAIGKILNGSEQRDAIHFAVAPVVAGEVLKPGTHVGFTQSNQEVVGAKGVHIGVIDPFLNDPVRPGQRCWLFLYPNTITALRHNWSHPAFINAPPASAGASEQWLRAFCERERMSYEELLKMADEGLVTFYGIPSETYEGTAQDELIGHLEAVLGKSIRGKTEFTCSC